MKKPGVLEKYCGKSGEHHWHVTKNGRIIGCSSEGYTRTRERDRSIMICAEALCSDLFFVTVFFNDGCGPELYGPYTETESTKASVYFSSLERVHSVVIQSPSRFIPKEVS
jgi:hypothetical protein